MLCARHYTVQALYISFIPCGLGPSVRSAALGKDCRVSFNTNHISVSREGQVWTCTLKVAEGVAAPCLPQPMGAFTEWLILVFNSSDCCCMSHFAYL